MFRPQRNYLLLLPYFIALSFIFSSTNAEQNTIVSGDEGSSISSRSFINSLGVNTHVSQGYGPQSYIQPLQYLGIRNIRDSERNIAGLIHVHRQTGVLVDLLGDSVTGLLAAARTLARAGALLSIEGPNEPNNFEITYEGKNAGGKNAPWLPIAQLQKDLYSAVKNDSDLKKYPVFHVSEGGAESENVGLQFLTIPPSADTLMPTGTKFADFANVHNYVSGNNAGHVDNQAWQSADPVLDGPWDGLYGEYGITWNKRFPGYSRAELETLPRVTTETGWNAPSVNDENVQGTVLINTFLAQFKRGWKYTFVYQLGEGEGGGGNQGLFHENWTPKLAATYIHNLTTILVDDKEAQTTRKLHYSIANLPPTAHHLLLHKSSGVFYLIIWGEKVSGSNDIVVDFGAQPQSVEIYDVTIGTMPTQSLAEVNSVPLTISDHAVVLEISGSGPSESAK